MIKSRIDERISAIRSLERKEQKAYRNENKKYFPIRKIKSFESSDDIIRFTEGTFVHPVATKEEEHRYANFAKDSQIGDCRMVEYRKQTCKATTRNTIREKPKMMQKHPEDCNPLHNFGVIRRQKIIDFFRDILHKLFIWMNWLTNYRNLLRACHLPCSHFLNFTQ